MKNNLTRILSIALVMMLILSCVPTMAFAAEGHAHAALNISTGAEYASLADAMAAAEAGQTVKVLADSDEAISYGEGVILDLDGHNLTNVTVPAGVTLTAIDSATDDYAGSFGSLSGDIAGTVAFTVKTAEPKSYVSVCENGSWSFHRYYAAITAISLKPATAALGYKAEFYGDETVKNAVVNYGYELWINDCAPKAVSKADKLEKNVLTLRLNNILKEGNDALNAMGSTANINGKAFITLNLNGEEVILYSAEKTTTLRSTIESINAYADSYSEVALQAVRSLCATYAPWMAGWATDAIFGIGDAPEAGDGLKVEVVVDVTAENGILTQDATMTNGDISVTVPQGTALNEGVTQLILTIAEKAKSDSDVEKGEGQSLIPLDVHIEGISADNTTPIIVCLGQVLPKGLNIGNYDLFHVENGETVPMTRVYTVSELDTHNEFCYDPATGSVTVAVASFSEITLRSAQTGTWEGGVDHEWYDADATTLYIYNADQLNSFAQIVGGMAEGYDRDTFSGQTVVLYSDINLNDLTDENDYVFYPVGYYNSTGKFEKVSGGNVTSSVYTFAGTFDGNGHTIKNFYQNTWEMFGDYNSGYSGTPNHYKDAMGLFGYVNGGTVKNLTVENFSSDGEFTPTGVIAAYACNATFENIAITNCNPRVYNTGNGGIVGIGGNDDDPDTYKLTFTNITIDNSNIISALWGSWDVACGGLVGMFRGAGHAYMTNCHVAAQIDVYNDVCGNYQYYWYRYAGMMIGTNKNMATDANGYTVPETTKYHAENCTVHFGTWNDYYYCEFVSNSLASYTHDHQMSRVPHSELIFTDTNGNGIIDTEAERESVTGCKHNHEAAGYETTDIDGDGEIDSDVLKEDKQAIYLPFNQLFTGYGWGVKHIPVYNGENYAFDGITILDREIADSVVKFDKVVADGTEYWTGEKVTIGTLFTANSEVPEILAINSKNVQVSVSPVGTTSTAGGIYTANTSDWTQGTLSFSGKGAAEIIITDYYFCIETRLEVYVDGYTVRYNDPTGITTVIYGEDGIDKLPSREAYEGMTFYGWSIAEVADKSTTATVISAGYKPAEKEIFLYAVYTYTETVVGSGDYEKVTSAPADWSGEYLIVYESGKVAFNGGLSTLDAVNNTISVTISNDTIASTGATDAATFTIEKYNTGYTILSKSGKYIGRTANSNGMNSGSTKIEHTFAMSGTNVTITSSNGYMLKYNNASGQYRFRYYGSGQQAVALYKKGVGGSETSTYYVSYIYECSEHPNTVTDYKAATCIAEGYNKVICADCGHVITDEVLPIIAHNYVDGQCSMCNKVKPNYVLVTDAATVMQGGDYVIVAEVNGKYYAMGTTVSGKIDATEVSVVNNELETEFTETWLLNPCNEGISLYNGSQFLAYGTSGTDFKTSGTAYEWTVAQEAGSATFSLTSASETTRGILYRESLKKFGAYAVSNAEDNDYTNQLYLFKIGTSEVCDHETTTVTTPATCTEEGSIVVSCTKCDVVLSSTPIEKLPHDYVDGSCSVCGADEVIVPEIPENGVYELVTNIDEITEGGKFVIVATVDGTYYALGEYESEKSAVLASEVSISGKYVTTADAPTWTIGKFGSNIALQNSNGYYLKQSSEKGATLSALKSDVFAWTILETDNAAIFHIANANEQDRGLVYRTGEFNYFRSYLLDNTTAGEYYPDLRLYKLVEGEIVECAHSNTTTTTTVEPTCSATGTAVITCNECYNVIKTETLSQLDHNYVGKVTTEATCGKAGVKTYTCSVCKDSYTDEIAATGNHEYTDGTCTNCGAEDPNYNAGGSAEVINATYSIAGTAGTVSGSNAAQTFTLALDVFTFTNVKADSSTAIRTSDSDHYRIYANSTVSVVGNNGQKITKISFTTTGSGYATALETSLKNAGYSVSKSGNVVTVTFTDAVDAINFTASAQIRISKIEISYYEN